MENGKQLPEGSRESRLPEELCREILSRLPAKSLLRFRSVSKSWFALTNDPDFRHLHLHNFKNNRDETHLLVVEGANRDCVLRRSDSFEPNQEKLHTLRAMPNSYFIECFIGGLFLLEKIYAVDGSRWAHTFVLWNPSIRKFHALPPVPEIEASPGRFFTVNIIGFGYDPLAKDYKYVELLREDPDLPPLVAIYTVGIGSWRIIQYEGDWDHGSLCHFRNACCLRGTLYFLAVNRKRDLVELVSFDLIRERFRTFSSSMPDEIAYGCRNTYSRFGKTAALDRHGCSSLLVFDFDTDRYLWAWDSESMCWTKPYPLYKEIRASELLYLKKNRDVLLSKLCAESEAVSSYNLETGEEKVLMFRERHEAADHIHGAYGHIESLVLL